MELSKAKGDAFVAETQVVAHVRGIAVAHGASPDVVEETYRAMIGAFIELELGAHRGAPRRED